MVEKASNWVYADTDSVKPIPGDEFNSSEVLSQTNLRWQFIKDDLKRNEVKFMNDKIHSIWVGTWNVNGRDVGDSLLPWMRLPEIRPDIIFVGLQEIDRRPEAYVISVSGKEAVWNSFILDNIRSAYAPIKYSLVTSRSLVGIYAALFVKDEFQDILSNISTSIAPCGLMGMMGNKGAVGIRVKIHNEYLCFVNSHLAPHGSNVYRRNQDYADLCKRLIFPGITTPVFGKLKTSFDEMIFTWNDNTGPASIWDCAILIWCGDLNYRVSLPAVETLNLALSGQYDKLLGKDQLQDEIANGRAFQEFIEYPIAFPPSYKYNIGSDSFDNKADPRPPAWTDRVLFRKGDRLEVRRYSSAMELRTSDHKPVSCLLNAQIKVIDPQLFEDALNETLRRLDRYENEAMPMTIVSANAMNFGEVAFRRAVTQSFELLNTGHVVAKFIFIPKLGQDLICPSWMLVKPIHGIVYPGSSIEIKILVCIDSFWAKMFNDDESVPEDILILHVEGGKDHFISIDCKFRKTPFCRELSRLATWATDTCYLPNSDFDFATIPRPVSMLVEHLIKFGLQVTNLFLESGDSVLLDEVQDCLDLERDLPNDYTSDMHLFSVAETLLRFLDSLPTPLIPYEFYGQCIASCENLTEAKLLMDKLPVAHKSLFQYLQHFIQNILLPVNTSLRAVDLAKVFGKVMLKAPPVTTGTKHDQDDKATKFLADLFI